MANLEDLKGKVTSLADEISSLKEKTPVDKDGIAKLIPPLLAAKQAYADANGGMGMDGKPYEAPLSKAEKKKRAKDEKAKALATAAAADDMAVRESGKQVCVLQLLSRS